MRGGLFSAYFLEEGIATTSDWGQIDPGRVAALRLELASLLEDFAGRHSPNEAETEADLIEPILRLIGWGAILPQQTAARTGRSDVPDYLLFADGDTKAAAASLPSAEKYRLGRSILEAKAWSVDLDKASRTDGAPSTQLIRYLGRVEVESDGGIRFGLLTNGFLWRLYDQKARSRLEGYVEVDLREAIGQVVVADREQGERSDRADHVLRTFLWLFGRDAFVPGTGGRTRLEQAIADSRGFEARVTKDLANLVFGTVFPDLAEALAQADPQQAVTSQTYRDELREAALTWLYRLLFVLYAEDRDLLPTRKRRDGLRAMRVEVAHAIDAATPLSTARSNYDGDLRALWRQIDEGDEGIGLPPYNGGLFRADRSSLLERALLPDRAFAPLLDALSRTAGRLINYRDLDVQHLGSVYERLLEYELAHDGSRVVARPQAFARKTSGSYYTPEELVMLVIRRAVGPLLDDKRRAFRDALADKERAGQAIDYRLGWLQRFDPAAAFLTLRICDPAMGSGHFLVSLVDYLADQVMLATRETAEIVAEAIEGAAYRSPLLDRLESIRARILAQAQAHGWAVQPEQLADDKLVRRIILKRVIHGVDKNPMAVELAKLSLWLHTFTVGAPLSFLDHHLRCGDSLFGEWSRSALDFLEARGLFARGAIIKAMEAGRIAESIEELTDADITEVHSSRDQFEALREATADARKVLSLLQGWRWVGHSVEDAQKQARRLRREADRVALSNPQEAQRKSEEAARFNRRAVALDRLLEGEFGEFAVAYDAFYGRVGDPDPAVAQLAEARAVAEIANFLHWEIAFPSVWQDWTGRSQRGGFDAVIGNPPWDRLKMQEVEWFASRKPEVAYQTTAAARKRMVQRLRDAGDPLAQDYETATRFAGMAARMAGLAPQKGGQFPLLGGGDVNLYSLFVERAAHLVKPEGLVGLLVPSGISGDLGASSFFRSISTTGRLGSLLDYENRGRFFEDVHRSFKFSAIAFSGAGRRFDAAECGFFLTATDDEELSRQTFPLTPADFAAVNPNSGTAPVFRSPRDADLVTSIYGRIPVLVDHRLPERERPWRIRYSTMFHMTNDSHLFHTAEALEADGWYPVAGGRWRKGTQEAVPLYEGKMVQSFDHRAASVIVNPGNLHRPAQPVETTMNQHENPGWLPRPQFWVSEAVLAGAELTSWNIAFKDVTAPTNVRTMIASAVPFAGYGNTLPIILIRDPGKRVLLLANLNSFALDYLARSKVQGQHLNWYIVEQLPILPPSAYERRFGKLSAREIVAREVLRLTYTAHDMAALARDMGHVDEEGEVLPPFRWDEDDRRQRRARLDALYFHLYGIERDDADYILSTFPIVRRQDEATHGRFVTRDLILMQMAALVTGDTEAEIALRE
jgi:hypothetical protein